MRAPWGPYAPFPQFPGSPIAGGGGVKTSSAGKALGIWRKALGEEHPNVADSYNNIGEVYRCTGKYDQALEYYEDQGCLFFLKGTQPPARQWPVGAASPQSPVQQGGGQTPHTSAGVVWLRREVPRERCGTLHSSHCGTGGPPDPPSRGGMGPQYPPHPPVPLGQRCSPRAGKGRRGVLRAPGINLTQSNRSFGCWFGVWLYWSPSGPPLLGPPDSTLFSRDLRDSGITFFVS